MKRFQVTLLAAALLAIALVPTPAAAQAVVGRPVNGPVLRAQLPTTWQNGFAWLVIDCETASACDTGGGDGTTPGILIWSDAAADYVLSSGAGGGGGVGDASDTEVLFSNAGVPDGVPGLTWDGTDLDFPGARLKVNTNGNLEILDSSFQLFSGSTFPVTLGSATHQSTINLRGGNTLSIAGLTTGTLIRGNTTNQPATVAGIQAPAATVRGLVIQGAGSQSANLAEFRDSSNNFLTGFDAAGNFSGAATPNLLDATFGCNSTTELTLDTNGDLAIPGEGCFSVDTFSDAASDTYDGGGTCAAGTVFALRQENAARDVILSASGMQVYGGVDQTLDEVGDIAYGFCPVANTPVISHFVDASGIIAAQGVNLGANPQPLRTTFVFPFRNGGSALAENQYVEYQIPWACNIIHSVLVGTPSGSVSIDLWVDDAGSDGATYPPTNADSITASAQPALSTDTYAADATLTGWTTLLPGPTDKDDPATYSWIRANIEGTPSTTTFAQLTLTCEHQ